MDLYFERHDGEAVTIEDFLACFADATGQDLAQFHRWYVQSGTPELVCDLKYDRRKKSAVLSVHQVQKPTPGQPRKKPQLIPLSFGLLGENGNEMEVEVDGPVLRDGVLAVAERNAVFKFKGVTSRPVPSLLRGFSAPVNVTMPLSDDDLAFLMLHDSDLFNRWQAGNKYAARSVLGLLGPRKVKSVTGKAAKYADALRSAIADPSLEDAYKAELLRLPSVTDIAREKAVKVDPAAIFDAHKRFASAVASALRDELTGIYERLSEPAPFSPDARSAGRRALRNATLTLLSTDASEEQFERLERHYFDATNMTDAAHALNLVANQSHPRRADVLAHFFERWKGDHLVIDMWFAAQAQSPRPEALDDVKALCQHPLFALTKPNKVRSLIGTFAAANPLQFNRPDGAGYEFLADSVLALDRLNPQVAARMLGAFRSYRALEPKRKAQAKAALRKIGANAELSRDCQELVTRLLED
jgi:aminopeptidase N